MTTEEPPMSRRSHNEKIVILTQARDITDRRIADADNGIRTQLTAQEKRILAEADEIAKEN